VSDQPTLTDLYAHWDTIASVKAREEADAAARRRIVLLALNEAGTSMRDLAVLAGVSSHNAVAKAITRAKADLATDPTLRAFHDEIT
jgi:hypothetical protein